MKKFNHRNLTAMALGLAACAFTLGGCTTSKYDEICADLTPELETLYEREVDMNNSWTMMLDENGRMFIQDLGRAFYWDRPSRLSPEPTALP